MATNVHTLKSVARAHIREVNGCSSLGPNLDDATEILRQAHGVLVAAAYAVQENYLNPALVGAALDGATTLLELGLRNTHEGHDSLLKRLRSAN